MTEEIKDEFIPEFLKPFLKFEQAPDQQIAEVAKAFPQAYKDALRTMRLKNIQISVEPREYQTQAVDSFMTKTKTVAGVGSVQRGVVVLPTGTGKTFIGILAMKKLERKTLILVPTEVLLYQWADVLLNTGLNVGYYYGLAHANLDGDVIVAIYNSVASHLEMIEKYKFKFIIADEVHHLGADVFSKILYGDKGIFGVKTGSVERDGIAGKDIAVMGLTSAIERSDYAHLALLQEIPIIYAMPIREAIDKGYLSRLKILDYAVNMSGDEYEKYEEYTQRIRNFYSRYGLISFKQLIKMADAGNGLAKGALQAFSLRQTLLASVEQKRDGLLDIVRQHQGKMMIVFSMRIEALTAAWDFLIKAGIKAGMYHSQIKDSDRIRILSDWKARKFDVLLSVKCLEEGVDVPEVGLGVIVASGKTNRQFIQRIGRLVRLSPGKGEASVYIVHARGTVEDAYAHKIFNLVYGSDLGELTR